MECIETYLQRLSATSSLLSRTYKVVEQCRIAREKAGRDLQELLAKKSSLRRADFNLFFRQALKPYETKEKNLIECLGSFLISQQQRAGALKEALKNEKLELVIKLKDTMKEEVGRIQKEVVAYEKEQVLLLSRLESFSEQDTNFGIGGFKTMMMDFKKLSAKNDVLLKEVC